MAGSDEVSRSEAQFCLTSVDQLLAKLGEALADQDWDELISLNTQVKPALEALIKTLETGEVEPEPVRARLEELRQFLDAAGNGATRAKAEAEQALKGLNRNHSAARAYGNVSTTRPK